MEEEGVKFVTGVNVGMDITAAELLKKYDSVILAGGVSNPRDIKVPGRESKGIYFAVDFLAQVTKTLLDSDFEKVPYELAKDKNVLVIGGGDTGNDCVGTSIRSGSKICYTAGDDAETAGRTCRKQSMATVAKSPENRLWPGRSHCCFRP